MKTRRPHVWIVEEYFPKSKDVVALWDVGETRKAANLGRRIIKKRWPNRRFLVSKYIRERAV